METNLLLFKLFIKKTSVEMPSCYNGKKALEKFKDNSYDMFFMDLQMPIMDGYTGKEKIRSYEKKNNLKRTPIIALSALSSSSEIEKAKKFGCDNDLSKPVKKDQFLAEIARWGQKTSLENPTNKG